MTTNQEQSKLIVSAYYNSKRNANVRALLENIIELAKYHQVNAIDGEENINDYECGLIDAYKKCISDVNQILEDFDSMTDNENVSSEVAKYVDTYVGGFVDWYNNTKKVKPIRRMASPLENSGFTWVIE